jgi:hypothetical protein
MTMLCMTCGDLHGVQVYTRGELSGCGHERSDFNCRHACIDTHSLDSTARIWTRSSENACTVWTCIIDDLKRTVLKTPAHRESGGSFYCHAAGHDPLREKWLKLISMISSRSSSIHPSRYRDHKNWPPSNLFYFNVRMYGWMDAELVQIVFQPFFLPGIVAVKRAPLVMISCRFNTY